MLCRFIISTFWGVTVGADGVFVAIGVSDVRWLWRGRGPIASFLVSVWFAYVCLPFYIFSYLWGHRRGGWMGSCLGWGLRLTVSLAL